MERVELCCHTGMSGDNSVASPRDLIKKAMELGMKAIAFTDIDSVQALPEACDTAKYMNEDRTRERKDAGLPEEEPLKVLYGAELRIIEDESSASTYIPMVVLAKNDTGLKNLYKMITLSHTTYINGWCRGIPISKLEEYRKELLIGSTSVLNEIAANQPEENIDRAAAFYDFLIVEPPCNLDYMVELNVFPDIKEPEDVRESIRRLIQTGEKLGIPVAASSIVRYVDQNDETAHRILADHNGRDDYDRDRGDHHLMSTDEMLAEFDFLGEEAARKIVVDNTNLISDQVGEVCPVKKGKRNPVYPEAELRLQEICDARVHELYGDDLPKEVSERLDKEMSWITDNGFASLYMYPLLLIKKSHEEGFPTLLRGLGGASFVAFLAGATDANPLKAHYICRKCRYTDFDTDRIKGMYPGAIGYDLPDRKCPVCGEDLSKDGFNVIEETFLGFRGDKEPDFDINFASEYRAKAAEYLAGLPGISETYIAGTVSKYGEKTADMIIRDYCVNKDLPLSDENYDHIADMLTHVRMTDGIHPGGVVIVPDGMDIHDHTPIQNKDGILSTHMEYHSVDSCLQKMDLLAHTAIDKLRMLEQETGVGIEEIPLEDEKMMSLFYGTEAFGIKREELSHGLAGVPEFSSMIGDLIDTVKPASLSDLIRLDGALHGTGVWKENAEELVKEGKEFRTCISTRDDIMLYLLDKGLSREDAYNIMEWVRKGKAHSQNRYGLKPEMEQNMLEHGVPEWYIDSCRKIRYLFPKAHSVQYTIQSWRLLYYKLYYPEAFYRSYAKHCISGNSGVFEHGMEYAKTRYKNLMKEKQAGYLSTCQEKLLNDCIVAIEMFARGIKPDIKG